jgi:hypothetical protein
MDFHIGGNPSFEMVDSKREALNRAALRELKGANGIEYLFSLQGRSPACADVSSPTARNRAASLCI